MKYEVRSAQCAVWWEVRSLTLAAVRERGKRDVAGVSQLFSRSLIDSGLIYVVLLVQRAVEVQSDSKAP